MVLEQKSLIDQSLRSLSERFAFELKVFDQIVADDLVGIIKTINLDI